MYASIETPEGTALKASREPMTVARQLNGHYEVTCGPIIVAYSSAEFRALLGDGQKLVETENAELALGGAA